MQITQIKETCLYVRDLDITEQFYAVTMGFKLIGKHEGRNVFFRCGSSVLLCFLPEVTAIEEVLPSHYASGKIHIAFEVQPEDYDAWKLKLRALDIEIVHEQSWDNRLKSFYFRDPDGHLLEIVPEGVWNKKYDTPYEY